MALLACSKTSIVDTKSTQTNSVSSSAKPEIKVVSNWISISPNSYFLNVDRLGYFFVTGIYNFDASTQLSYDDGAQVELAYARIPIGRVFQYQKLSFDMQPTNVFLNYSLDPDGFKLNFKNGSYNSLVDAVNEVYNGDWRFRYIVIPKSQFDRTNIDWNNYLLVASTLNFIP